MVSCLPSTGPPSEPMVEAPPSPPVDYNADVDDDEDDDASTGSALYDLVRKSPTPPGLYWEPSAHHHHHHHQSHSRLATGGWLVVLITTNQCTGFDVHQCFSHWMHLMQHRNWFEKENWRNTGELWVCLDLMCYRLKIINQMNERGESTLS